MATTPRQVRRHDATRQAATDTAVAAPLTVTQAATGLGVSRATVYRLIHSGKLAAFDPTGTGSLRVERSEVEAHKQRTRVRPNTSSSPMLAASPSRRTIAEQTSLRDRLQKTREGMR